MNIRQTKLTLSMGLLQQNTGGNVLGYVKSLMTEIQGAGRFMGEQLIHNASLNGNHTKETYALRYENCVLNVDLVSSAFNNKQTIQGFSLS